MNSSLEKDRHLLFETLLKLKSVEELESLFNDLCTYKELNSMTQRLRAAKLLINNATYEQIIKQTDISSATLSRVSKCVQFGNGYKSVLKN